MKIRQANQEDSAGVAKVQVDSYLIAYADIFPPAYLKHFAYEEQAQDWRDWFSSNKNEVFYVAETQKGEIIDYALGKRNSEEIVPYKSELVALHVVGEY